MTVSFGYVTGSGSAVNFSNARQRGSKFLNNTGSTVYVDQIDLLNVTTARSGTHQCAIYTDNEGMPGTLIGVTDILSSVAVGTNTFAVAGDPINVAEDQVVWLFIRHSTTLSMSGTGASLNLIEAFTSGSSAFPARFMMLGGGLSDSVMPLVAYGETTDPGTSNQEVNLAVLEALSVGDDPPVRVALSVQEALSEGYPNTLINLVNLEALSEGYPNIINYLTILEVLHPVPPELPMSTDPFPGFGNSVANPSIPEGADPFNSALPGLSFNVKKTPQFSTNIKESAALTEVRNALARYPRWNFSLTYDFLEDRTGAESSLKTILGFFLGRQGSYDSWLFKDPDDYLVSNGICGNSDGVTTEFPFCRSMGSYVEKVGQIDTDNAISVYLSISENGTIPATPGPYTLTVANSAAFVEDLGVTKGGSPMTKVVSAPAAGQYSVAAGVYTFNATDENDLVVISYRYTVDPSDYEVTMPNLVVFDSAPDEGVVSASFQFFFACRFIEDQMDFEKFSDKLWNLRECNFKSIIQ